MAKEIVTFNSKWTVAIGTFLLAIGILSIGLPMVSTFSLVALLGLGFLVSGVVQLMHLFSKVRDRGRLSYVFLSALSFIAGVVVLRNPVVGAMAITLAVAFYFLASAVGRGILFYEWRGFQGRGWLICSLAISVFLGGYLIVNFPVDSVFIPGLFFGVDLIFYGFSLIAFGLSQKGINHSIRSIDVDRVA